MINFWGWEPVGFSKKKSDRVGLENFSPKPKRVDWFYLDDKGYYSCQGSWWTLS